MRPSNHTSDLPPLQPHQVGEVGMMLAQGGVERGRGVAFLPLHQRRQERRPASEASDPGTPRQQTRCEAQASALLVPPWQPAELPGDEEGDGEEDDAAERHDDRQQADGDLCGKKGRFRSSEHMSSSISSWSLAFLICQASRTAPVGRAG